MKKMRQQDPGVAVRCSNVNENIRRRMTNAKGNGHIKNAR